MFCYKDKTNSYVAYGFKEKYNSFWKFICRFVGSFEMKCDIGFNLKHLLYKNDLNCNYICFIKSSLKNDFNKCKLLMYFRFVSLNWIFMTVFAKWDPHERIKLRLRGWIFFFLLFFQKLHLTTLSSDCHIFLALLLKKIRLFHYWFQIKIICYFDTKSIALLCVVGSNPNILWG